MTTGTELGWIHLLSYIALAVLLVARYDKSIWMAAIIAAPFTILGHLAYYGAPVYLKHKDLVSAVHEMSEVPPSQLRQALRQLQETEAAQFLPAKAMSVARGKDGALVRVQYEVRVRLLPTVEFIAEFDEEIVPGRRLG